MKARQAIACGVLLACAIALAIPCAFAQPPYTNPVIGDPRHVERELPDPFVLRWNGEYYLYTSGSPIVAYHSTDLVKWDLVGPVLEASDKPDAWNQADVWAPEVVYRNGKFYMYYTASRKSEDWRVGEMARRIGVAVSNSPRGPFVDSGQPVTPGWGIDGTVFRDPDSGIEYLFYSYLYEPRLPGAGIVADRLASWNLLTGKPAHITRGSEAWEDKDGDPDNGSLRYTNEAPTVVKHDGRYYMMYSGGSWDLPTYSLAYATSDQPPQGDLNGPGWNKAAAPILRSTPLVDAPGHNAMVKAPNNVDDMCVYHARVVPFLDPWNRLPFVDRLYWNHDRMFMQQPSLGDLPAPDRPVFEASSMDRQLAAEFAAGKTAQHLSQAAPYTHFIYELNLRLLPQASSRKAGPDAAVPGAGAIVYYKDDNSWIRVSLEAKSLVLRARLAGQDQPPVSRDLPLDFDQHALHQLLITRNGDRIDVMLDGVAQNSRVYDLKGDRGAYGVFSAALPVEFGYRALTPYYNDRFETGDALNSWVLRPQPDWLVQEGALHQVGAGSGRVIALKGDAAQNYEFSASLLWRDNDTLSSKAGVVAASAENGNDLVLAGFEKNIWPFARFWVGHVIADQVRESFSVDLPRGFQYNVYHTIRVVKQGSAFRFFLDGKELADSSFAIAAAQPGLFTQGVRAAFDDVSMKHIKVPQNLLLDASFESEQWKDAHPAAGNAWRFSGTARVNDCCAHSGLRRLLLEGSGDAQQTVSGLSPGRYVLHAWTLSTPDISAEIAVAGLGEGEAKTAVMGEQWRQVVLEFTVPPGASSATVHFRAAAKSGSPGYAAADDFYLYKQE